MHMYKASCIQSCLTTLQMQGSCNHHSLRQHMLQHCAASHTRLICNLLAASGEFGPCNHCQT